MVEPRRHRAGQAADDPGCDAERRPDYGADGAADRPPGRRARRRAGVSRVVAHVLSVGRRRRPRKKKGKYQGFSLNPAVALADYGSRS